MKKHFLIILLFISYNSFSQDYSFITKDFSKIDKYKYSDYVYKKAESKIFNENGSIISLIKMDSISKNYVKHPYNSIYFGDSINNKSITVIHYYSKEEYQAISDKFQENQKKEILNRKELMGSSIDKLNLTDIDGNKYSLESLKGKTIVLNFWYTKCPPCIKEMPDLNKLKAKYQSNDVVFFAVTFNQKDIVKRFLEKTKLDYTIIPNDQATIDQFKISFFPTNVLINKEGKVEYVNEMMKGNGIEEINKILKKLVKQ